MVTFLLHPHFFLKKLVKIFKNKAVWHVFMYQRAAVNELYMSVEHILKTTFIVKKSLFYHLKLYSFFSSFVHPSLWDRVIKWVSYNSKYSIGNNLICHNTTDGISFPCSERFPEYFATIEGGAKKKRLKKWVVSL